MVRSFLALGLLVSCLAFTPVSADQAQPAAQNPILVLETSKGEIEIEFFPAEAPKSVAHVLDLARRNFYRAHRIHWVQPGVIQFGDPQTRDMTKQWAWGTGGSGRGVGVAETSKRPFARGSVGLAYRENQKPTAADSQIFILRSPSPNLNGKYAWLGRVTKGLNVVDKLVVGDMITRFGPRAAAAK